MEEITAYKCDHCGKVYQNKGSCAKHEKRCFFNPITKACASCEYLSSEIDPVDFERVSVCHKDVDLSKGLQHHCDHHDESRN